DPDQLVLGYRARLPSFVVAAVAAHAVRRLRLVTVRALAEARGLQRVVRAALGRPRLGMASFGIRHRGFSFPFSALSARQVADLPSRACSHSFPCSGSSRTPGTAPGSSRCTAASSATRGRTA